MFWRIKTAYLLKGKEIYFSLNKTANRMKTSKMCCSVVFQCRWVHMWEGVINYFVVCYENEVQCIICAVRCCKVSVNTWLFTLSFSILLESIGFSGLYLVEWLKLPPPTRWDFHCSSRYIERSLVKSMLLCHANWISMEPREKKITMNLDAVDALLPVNSCSSWQQRILSIMGERMMAYVTVTKLFQSSYILIGSTFHVHSF